MISRSWRDRHARAQALTSEAAPSQCAAGTTTLPSMLLCARLWPAEYGGATAMRPLGRAREVLRGSLCVITYRLLRRSDARLFINTTDGEDTEAQRLPAEQS